MLSPALQEILERLPPHDDRPPPPTANDLEGWRAAQREIEERAAPACGRAIAQTGVRLCTQQFAGMDTLVIAPPGAHDAAPAIFIHGGAYTTFSARSSLFASAPLAVALARPIISLDYPLAPHATFHTIVPAVANAITAICAQHKSIAVIGDSAGGGLALAALRTCIQAGASSVRALALISPWTNLANTGESHHTRAASDPILAYEPGLRVAAEAYAGCDLAHPDASPGLATYDASFPPCFIVCGSNEILLSDALALRDIMVGAEMFVARGLFHSFPTIAPHAPESQKALAKIREFLDARLGSSPTNASSEASHD